METCRTIVICAILGLAIPAMATPSIAGELTRSGHLADSEAVADPSAAPALAYRFTTCTRPKAPKINLEKSRKWGVSRKDARRYNEYVSASNAYFQCLSKEADADLDAYYAAVNGAFEAEQARLLDEIDVYSKALDARPIIDQPGQIEGSPLPDLEALSSGALGPGPRPSPDRADGAVQRELERKRQQKEQLDDILLGGD